MADPTRGVDGETIPPYTTRSSSGVITPEILTGSLKHLARHTSFDRRSATTTLLLDGHGSRFDETSLVHVDPDNKETGNKWNIGWKNLGRVQIILNDPHDTIHEAEVV